MLRADSVPPLLTGLLWHSSTPKTKSQLLSLVFKAPYDLTFSTSPSLLHQLPTSHSPMVLNLELFYPP